MACFAYDQTGSARDNPDQKEMLTLLQSMAAADPGQPDVSLNDDDGWSIAYGRAKTVTFGNIETGQGPWHMKNVPLEQALELWVLFAAANLTALQSKPWVAGNG